VTDIVFSDRALRAERRRCTFAFGVEETLLYHPDETRNYMRENLRRTDNLTSKEHVMSGGE
jgi:hypothetical protein